MFLFLSFEFWSDLTAWITILNSDPAPPLVHSVSYGEQAEHQVAESFKQRFEVEMQKLGKRGNGLCLLCVLTILLKALVESPSSLLRAILAQAASCAFAT